MDDDQLFQCAPADDEIQVNSIKQIHIQDIIIPLKIKDLFDEYFTSILNQNANQIKLNVFIMGYKCDQGIRACGGRSGAELGAEVFRDIFFKSQSDLASKLKDNNIKIYDLGNFFRYELSPFAAKSHETSMSEVIKFIQEKIPKCKIVIIGGSDDVNKSIYSLHTVKNVIHFDSQIDVKPKFKI